MEIQPFPGNKRFALAIIDDTDQATVDNVKPVYALLERLGLRATKTVWPVGCPEGGGCFSGSQTLEDSDYLTFTKDLQRRGFELTWHCATMQSSRRERTLAALERFRAEFGFFPRVHINHANNREGLYWGVSRFDDPLVQTMAKWVYNGRSFEGHVEGSPYWWGDLCAQHITYARNLTFTEINLRRVNPTMPYRDPNRHLVPYWFSAVEASSANEFVALLSTPSQDRLEWEGGFCVIATHFGKWFVRNGEIDPRVERCLTELAARPGWFPNTGELLDWLLERNGGPVIPKSEWRRMQWRWAVDQAMRKWRERRRKRGYKK